MAIYESLGFGNSLHPFDKKEPFDYVADFKPKVVPDGVAIEEYKRTQAPYCLSGKVKPDGDGQFKRNNDSLINRDLIFLDYDEIDGTSEGFIGAVRGALGGYSYILYPTIKHTAEKPRFRLVVKPSGPMTQEVYKQVIQEIADKIGLPYDTASLTWSQLQGLPVTTGDPSEYQKIVARGLDYPVLATTKTSKPTKSYSQSSNQPSMTMRIIDTLLHGFGEEGGRNMALARFVGLLFNKWVDCDIITAYELVQVANSITPTPLPTAELDRTFESIARAEYRKRG